MEYSYNIKTRDVKCSLNDTQTIIFFGDVHRDTNSCDVDRWKWFLKNAQKTLAENPNTLFVSMGDTHDFASFSEVKKLKGASLHDDTYDKFDMIAMEDNRKFCEEIGFMRGRLLGFVEGNHGWVMQDGKTANEDLAERMGAESLGWLCHYTLSFTLSGRNYRHYVDMVLCHGRAGGKTEGASLNQLDELRRVFPIADIYAMGHDHQRLAKPASVITPITYALERKLKQKRQFMIRSGSFKKAYADGSHSYEISRLLKPSDLGAITVNIRFHRDRKGTDRIITDIQCVV